MTINDIKKAILIDFQQESNQEVIILIANFAKKAALEDEKTRSASDYDHPEIQAKIFAILADEFSFVDDGHEHNFNCALREIKNDVKRGNFPNGLFSLLQKQYEKYSIQSQDIIDIFAELDANSEKIIKVLKYCICCYFGSTDFNA